MTTLEISEHESVTVRDISYVQWLLHWFVMHINRDVEMKAQVGKTYVLPFEINRSVTFRLKATEE